MRVILNEEDIAKLAKHNGRYTVKVIGYAEDQNKDLLAIYRGKITIQGFYTLLKDGFYENRNLRS